MRPAALAADPLVPTVDSQRSLAPRHEASTGTKLCQHADPSGPPGTKLSPHTQKRRFRPTFRTQGESFHAHANNKPRRENFVPHARPVPVQNSPSTQPRGITRYKTLPARGPVGPTRYKTLPARPKYPFSAHVETAGRVLYRFHQHQAEQGEKSHAPTPHLTPPRRPSPNFACNSTTQVTQHHELTHTSMMLAGNCMRISVRAPRLAAFMTPACRQEHTRPQHRNKTRPTTRLLGLTAKKFAQQAPSNGTSAKKFAQHAKKR